MRLLINDILGFNDSAALASNLIADYVPGLLQLFEGGADRIHTFLADCRYYKGTPMLS